MAAVWDRFLSIMHPPTCKIISSQNHRGDEIIPDLNASIERYLIQTVITKMKNNDDRAYHQPKVPKPFSENPASDLTRPYCMYNWYQCLYVPMNVLTGNIDDVKAPFCNSRLVKILSRRYQRSGSVSPGGANFFQIAGKKECRNVCDNVNRQRAFGWW